MLLHCEVRELRGFFFFTEFTSLKKLYEEFQIQRYSTNSPLKSVLVENSNKAIQNLLYRAMTARNSAKWIDLLDDVATHMNAQSSRKLYGLSPNEAHSKINENYLREKYLEDYKIYKSKFRNRRPKFKVGDHVRVLLSRGKFKRGYQPSYSNMIYEVKSVLKTYPWTFKLKNAGERSFYAPELIASDPVQRDTEKLYFIAQKRIVNAKKTRSGRIHGGEMQYLLRARNDKDLSTWITQLEYNKLIETGKLAKIDSSS